MAVSDISTKRSLLSYAKVQRLVSRVIRNKPLFFSKNAGKHDLLNVGCGLFPVEGFVNLDWHWCPGVDVCWDLRKPYPFNADRFSGGDRLVDLGADLVGRHELHVPEPAVRVEAALRRLRSQALHAPGPAVVRGEGE